MPLAVTRATERFDLKTVEGGYVVVRRFTFGEKLQRRAFNSKMQIEASSSKNLKSEIDMFSEQAEIFDFAKGVVEHNLTWLNGENEEPLDFSRPAHVRMLDAIVSEEIATYIDKLNNFEDDDEVKK